MPVIQTRKSRPAWAVCQQSIQDLKSQYECEMSFFSQRERKAIKLRAFPNEGFAARIAAKRCLEGVLRRLGYKEKLSYARISVLNNAHGAPYFDIRDTRLCDFMSKLRLRCHLSLSHTRTDGIAAILYKRG